MQLQFTRLQVWSPKAQPLHAQEIHAQLDLFRERSMERYLSMIVHNELMKVLDPPPALPPSKGLRRARESRRPSGWPRKPFFFNSDFPPFDRSD